MEPEGSLPHSQEPATCPNSKPYKSSPCPSCFLKLHFNIIVPLKKRKNFETLSNPTRPPTIIFVTYTDQNLTFPQISKTETWSA